MTGSRRSPFVIVCDHGVSADRQHGNEIFGLARFVRLQTTETGRLPRWRDRIQDRDAGDRTVRARQSSRTAGPPEAGECATLPLSRSAASDRFAPGLRLQVGTRGLMPDHGRSRPCRYGGRFSTFSIAGVAGKIPFLKVRRPSADHCRAIHRMFDHDDDLRPATRMRFCRCLCLA